LGIGDVDVAGKIGGHPGRLVEFGASGGLVVAVIALLGQDPGKDGVIARSVDLENNSRDVIGDIEIAGGIKGQSAGDEIDGVRAEGERSIRGGKKRGDDAGLDIDHANGLVTRIGDVDVAKAVDREARRRADGRVDGQASVTEAIGLLGATGAGVVSLGGVAAKTEILLEESTL